MLTELRQRKAAAFISGAGPAVLAVAGISQEDMVSLAPVGWTVRALGVSAAGAREVPMGQPAAG